MKKLVVLIWLAAACGPPPERHYYTLLVNAPATRFEHPFPVKLRVRNLEMRRSYRRDEIVVRTDAHELTYMRSRRWSEPPERMISGLVREQLRSSGITAEVQDDSSLTDPDFVLTGEIEALEQLDVGRDRFAHAVIGYRLLRFKDDTTVWTYRVDAKRPVGGTSVRNTVRALSEMLAEETDRTIADLGRYFTDPSAPRAAPQAVGPTPPEAPPESLVLPDPASPLNQLAQVQRDDTPVPVGRGAVFAPTLSDGDREPRAALYQDGTEIAEGQLGARLVVPPGDYELRVGSGAVSQQVAVKVRVVEGKTTVVPPSWASLDILVVGDTFLPFRGTYELIRMADREELGLGFGADETLGEVTRVWVLAPGLYKIIRAGGTYRDRTNFATVRLEADKLTRFTLVLDKDDGSFHGAGENDPGISDIATTDEEAESKWKLRGLVGGDLNLNRSTMLGAPPGLRLSFRIFLDGSAAWIDGPNVWVTRLELEEGETRLLDRGVFQNDTDRLFLNTIYTHQLLSWFGPYVRFGLETKLLPRNQDFDPPRDVVVLDASGQIVEMRPGVTRVELGSTFAPLQLKEGAGGNFRVLRSTALELNLRVGFGAQQTVANGLYVFEDIAGAPGQLVPVVNSSVTGPEATLVGVGRLSKFITIITELEGLLPVGSDSGVVFTWRNQATLRLISFISLVYRFNMTRNPNLGIGDEARTEHDLQLRFSYVLF